MASTPTPSKSRFSFAVLLTALLVTLCLSMVGGSAYIKYKLDRSETMLAAPDSAFAPEQSMYEKTVLALGYSGFLGAAQTFMQTHDRAALGDMRMNLKTARETITRLGEGASNATRRDMTAILSLFDGLIQKAENAESPTTSLTSGDLLTASASLSTLETRLQSALASQRTTLLDQAKTWSLLLMTLTWGSLLLLAIGGIAAFALTRDKTNEPLLALRQSIESLAQGDMETPVWGLERRDVIGDLARTIEKARLAFNAIPDMAVETEEGLVKYRFEGEARSLFEAMTRTMTEDFQRAQQNALGYTGTMNAHQDMLTSIIAKLGMALDHVQMQSADHDEAMAHLTQTLCAAATNMAQAQEETDAKVSSLVPHMQERIQKMAEVTHLAGDQISRSLQTFVKAEQAVRNNAAQSNTVVQQLANATNQMGERMFAALNLMQASGKMLNETTTTVKVRFNEAVENLGRGENHLQQIITRAENRLASTVNAEENMAALAARTETSAEKMERAVNNICERHEGLSEQVVTATHRMESIVASFDAAQRAMSEATTQVRRDGNMISSLLSELRANNDQLLSSVNQNSQSSFSAVQSLAEKSHALMQRLEVQIAQQAQTAEARIDELTSHGKVMAQNASSTSTTLTQTIASLKSEQDKLATARTRFTETLADIGNRFEQQATATFGKTEQFAAQSFTKLSSIAEQVESVMQRLGMLGQLTGTLGTVAGQLGQLVPTLTQLDPSKINVTASGNGINMEETKALIAQQTEDVMAHLHNEWHEAVIQIEAMHDQLAQIVIQQKDQLETRLVVMDKKLREAAETMQSGNGCDPTDDKQAEIMNEIISAISKINEHVMELDDTIEEAGLKKEA